MLFALILGVIFVAWLTVLVFLWGLFQMVRSSDGAAREEARGYVIWGVVALFVMVSVWGLVNLLVRTFNLENTTPSNLQQLVPMN